MTEMKAEQLGFDPRPREIEMLEKGTEEKLANRTGGAVTLAVGMAKVFASVPGMKSLMAYWYHFVIMFEALFILTLLETARASRGLCFRRRLLRLARLTSRLEVPATEYAAGADADTHSGGLHHRPHWGINIIMSIVVCSAWGYLLYMGTLDMLWRMLGIANQLLAAIALAVGTTYLLLHAPKRRYALCTGIPFVFILFTVVTASVMSIHGWWVRDIPAAAPDKVFLLKLLCFLASAMLVLTIVITVDAVRRWIEILSGPVRARRDAEAGCRTRLRPEAACTSRIDEPYDLNRFAAFERARLGVELWLALDGNHERPLDVFFGGDDVAHFEADQVGC